MRDDLSLEACRAWRGDRLLSDSFVFHDNAAFWLDVHGAIRQLAILAAPSHPTFAHSGWEAQGEFQGYRFALAPTGHTQAQFLRDTLPWLEPALIGLRASAGFGDRLGLATPGHVQTLRNLEREFPEATIVPIFAQQSIREMTRTQRSPENVLDDATWGAFAGGWRQPAGADADHVKTTEDIDNCAAVGFTFYTIDPGEHVDSAADSAAASALAEKLERVPWARLETSAADFLRRYADRRITLEDHTLTLHPADVRRAAVKYGAAIAHVATMYRHLAGKAIPFELEVSVDETATPTTFAEHILFVEELRRLGVQWVSLAPRFVGAFEKGIDYKGNLAELKAHFAVHAQIARAFGPYKLSLHSGSDKFSVYLLFAEATRGMAHLKTAGTSYVEALRVIAVTAPALFRDIVEWGAERYPTDRASYHVSAEVAKLPDLARVADDALPDLLDDVHLRQVVHVTFGSTLEHFHEPIFATLRANQREYDAQITRHFTRHLQPFFAALAGARANQPKA
jgi:hypothetical protein